VSAAGCNWLVPDEERTGSGERPAFCIACRLNRIIPDQTFEANQRDWGRIELAKRRLVSQLLALGLPVQSRLTGAGGEDGARGLAFDFLRPVDGQSVMTGHAGGIVTLNVDEADDPVREQIRARLREPYRTLLGHLRHEVGHYYWDRLVAGSDWIGPFRTVFGDERADYGAALERHYRLGPAPDWAQWHVSAYAASHPWEDWAETWAHYLHMVDALDTGLSFGLDADDVEVDVAMFGAEVLETPDPEFLRLVNAWVELTALLNEMSRSMGEHDFHPFVLPRAAVPKLHFVHMVVSAARLAAPLAPKPLKPEADEAAGGTDVAGTGDDPAADTAADSVPGGAQPLPAAGPEASPGQPSNPVDQGKQSSGGGAAAPLGGAPGVGPQTGS